MFEEERKARVERFLARAGGSVRVEIAAAELLAGGAIQENWGFSAEFAGGPFDGRQRLVLRTDAPTGIAASLGRVEEFAVLRAAFAAGVTVPEPLWACTDPGIIGKPFFVMRRVSGTAQGRGITTDAALDPQLPEIAARLGQELGRLQAIRPPRPDLSFLPPIDAVTYITGFRAYLDRHQNARPVLEWGIRWLETHIPAALAPVLCHRDFRTGNYVLDGPELTGILDWEFAGWGDPDEDIGWFCCKGWRFARLDRAAGGIADREPFYRAYEQASGRRLDPGRVRFWEVLANVRWAVMALQQSDRHLIGGASDLSTAIIGRRATECELELLMLLDGEGPPAPGLPAGETPAVRDAVRDSPGGVTLAMLGREWLLNELLPLLPSELHRNLRLLATAIAIAEREAAAGEAPAREVENRLVEFYGPRASRPLLQPLECGQDARGPIDALLHRLAADLRSGAFEQCASRGNAARAILWRLTMLKLREGNPGFLAANGFGE